MTKSDVQQAIQILESNAPFPDFARANQLIAQSGVRNSNVQTALYFVNTGDMEQAKKLGRSAAVQLRDIVKTYGQEATM
jgi:hypothetical protein